MIKTLLCTTVLALTAASAIAGEAGTEKYPIDVMQESCLDRADTTLEMIDCKARALKAWDKEMNVQYQRALEGKPAKVQTQIKASQRAWIQYRDSYFAAMRTYYGGMDGTIWGIVLTERQQQVIRDKAIDLKQFNDSARLD